MTIIEAITKITSEPKYYIGKLPQSTASCIVRNIKAGTAKQKTILNFMSKFGYTMIQEAQWTKK